MGDDTNGKVLEIDKHLRDGEELVDPPAESLIAQIAESFGRVFPKKRGKGHKRKLIEVDPALFTSGFRTAFRGPSALNLPTPTH